MEHTTTTGDEIRDYERLIMAMKKMSPATRMGTRIFVEHMADKRRRNWMVITAISLVLLAASVAYATNTSLEVFGLIVIATAALLVVLVLWALKIL